jgi:hypothetical protein
MIHVSYEEEEIHVSYEEEEIHVSYEEEEIHVSYAEEDTSVTCRAQLPASHIINTGLFFRLFAEFFNYFYPPRRWCP